MTVKFMVLAAPRSGTSWAANWLTTEKTLCYHDPILTHREDELDRIACDRMLGISCSGLALMRDFVNAHPARKVILHRQRREIDNSLTAIGLSPLRGHWDGVLERIDGVHVHWREILDARTARYLYEFLTGLPFDAQRHARLVDLHVEPAFDRVHVEPDRARHFRTRIQEALHASV